jgi:AcrR family transcriptional regulator
MSRTTVTRGERTQAEIVQAAHRLFLNHGYHGTSMRQIASEAGVALGGIYNHFASKEDIFIAVLVEGHPFHDVMPALLAAEGETIEGFIRDAATRMVAQTQNRIGFLNLMFIELVEFNGRHLSQMFQIFFPGVLTFAQRFVEGKEELRPIPLMVIVRAFIGLFFSYIMTDLIIGEQLPPEMGENALEYFVEIYLHGILVGDPGGEVGNG